MATPEASTTVESAPPPGILSSIVDILFSPREGFAGVLRKPGFWLPLALGMVIGLAFVGIWLHKMDPAEFMKAQMIENGQWDKIPAESRQGILETQSKVVPMFVWGATLVFPLVGLLVISGGLLFIYRFFYAGQVTFKQSATLVAYMFLAVGIVLTPLRLLIYFLKGDWNLPPEEVIQANATLFLERENVSKAVWALASSLDLVVLWQVWLLAAAFAVATGKRTSSALWGVLVPWALFVAVKVLFKMF